MHPYYACTLHTELPEGWYGAGAVDQGALEVHGHVASEPGRPARLAALPAAHPPVVQPHCTAAQALAGLLLRPKISCTAHVGLLERNARQSSFGLSRSTNQRGFINDCTCFTLESLFAEHCLWRGPDQRTYCVTAACCKQVRVQGADCEGVDGHPGLNNPCLLLPLISCTTCLPMSQPDLLMDQHSWPCCIP